MDGWMDGWDVWEQIRAKMTDHHTSVSPKTVLCPHRKKEGRAYRETCSSVSGPRARGRCHVLCVVGCGLSTNEQLARRPVCVCRVSCGEVVVRTDGRTDESSYTRLGFSWPGLIHPEDEGPDPRLPHARDITR